MADTTVNPELEKRISDLLAEVCDEATISQADKEEGHTGYSLIDKLRVIDRALTLEKVKKGGKGGAMGSAFFDDEEELPDEPPPNKETLGYDDADTDAG